MSARREGFRARLLAREPLLGTFVKTPSPLVCEALGRTALDAVCIDGEHAPFDRLATDLCLGTLRALDCPGLVRVGDDRPATIRDALDSGAAGIVVPHVTSASQAAAIVKAAHFGEGGRGFAGSTRAAQYTTKAMADHLADSRSQTTVVVQIEDLAALDHVAAIAAVDGVDAIFVGRVDLAVAMGRGVADPKVIDTVRTICTEAAPHASVGMFTPDLDELPNWRRAGASLFLLSSDHSLMMSAANEMAARFARAAGV